MEFSVLHHWIHLYCYFVDTHLLFSWLFTRKLFVAQPIGVRANNLFRCFRIMHSNCNYSIVHHIFAQHSQAIFGAKFNFKVSKKNFHLFMICVGIVLIVINFYIFLSTFRSRFLKGEELNISTIVNQKGESINIIKFIGRQHFELTDLMDQLNFCYSIQVNIRLTAKTWLKTHFFYWIIDNAQRYVYIRFCCSGILFILSLQFSTKSILQGPCRLSIWMAIVLFCFHAYRHLHGTSSDKRSKEKKMENFYLLPREFLLDLFIFFVIGKKYF